MHELSEIYKLHGRDIVSLAFHYLGNVQEAEDIAQEVFIKLNKNMSTFSEDMNIKAWLYRVAVNLCFDKKRHYKVVLNHIKNVFISKSDDEIYYGNKKIEINNEINDLLSCVDKKTRMILILKFMEEMGYDEISAIVGIPVGTLKSMISRSLTKIRNNNAGNL